MKVTEKKIIASAGKILFCKKLNMYAYATTDKENEWVEVDEKENNDGE